MCPGDLEHVCHEKERGAHYESAVCEEAELAETIELIDTRLPAELRSAYLQMRDGVRVSKARRALVMDAVRRILEGDDCVVPRGEPSAPSAPSAPRTHDEEVEFE